MNKKIDSDILLYLIEQGYTSQRQIAEEFGCSLGMVNQSLKRLYEAGIVRGDNQVSPEGKRQIEENSPRQAVILAAGAGMRMLPINMEVSKGMLEIKGEPLIERIIRQLREVGIEKICIVVGFMKEQYEYLMDKYQVALVVNREYESKNNLLSLACAEKYLENGYIVPSDIWCEKNPFRKQEAYSWYMVQETYSDKSDVVMNRKGELVRIKPGEQGNEMTGIAYLNTSTAKTVRETLQKMVKQRQYDQCFWEEALYDKQKMIVWGRTNRNNGIFEINTYEQLRQLDAGSIQLDSEIIRLIAKVFCVQQKDVRDIQVLKKGMTNRSFQFSCKGKRYIMRMPGEGTSQMINRKQEASVYEAIREEHICDEVYYMNPENGYKITEFIEGIRTCDPENWEDVRQCMDFLRNFHTCRLKVEHEFDLFGQIEFYETLWEGKPSVYRDYSETKANVLSLKPYIESQKKDYVLTHIDAVPDNFLISNQRIWLIDWEYAGMQDPHLDIAMFAVYALYDKEQTDTLIDLYFEKKCRPETRKKIYCYIAAAGLLWSNWCEYKRQLGVEFGEYSLRQYRYAKEYYRFFQNYEEAGEEKHA